MKYRLVYFGEPRKRHFGEGIVFAERLARAYRGYGNAPTISLPVPSAMLAKTRGRSAPRRSRAKTERGSRCLDGRARSGTLAARINLCRKTVTHVP